VGQPSITVSALSRDTSTSRKVLTFPFVEGFGFGVAFAHATKARFQNPAVESGSTNHLSGH
jgi:hypothetical protein